METSTDTGSGTRPCLWCGEPIKPSARICRHCNREQVEEKQEEVLYEGRGYHPWVAYLFHGLLMCALIGFITLPLAILSHRSRIYRITTRRIEIRRGILTKTADVLELYRVNDLQYRSELGFGSVVLHTTDTTSPTIKLPIPRAEQVYRQLQDAVNDARSKMGVSVREHV